MQAFQKYDVRYVDQLNDAVKQYNAVCSNGREITLKESAKPLSFDWSIPLEYKELNVEQYVWKKFGISTTNIDDTEFENRLRRCKDELDNYNKRGLFDVLRVIIYVINTLTAKGAVWGVGRGSSVSSYVLYLIGAHDVDSYAYQLEIGDFLRD